MLIQDFAGSETLSPNFVLPAFHHDPGIPVVFIHRQINRPGNQGILIGLEPGQGCWGFFMSEVLRSGLLIPISDDSSPFSKIPARVPKNQLHFKASV